MKRPTFLILALVLLGASAWGQVTTGSITAGGADCLTAGRCVSLALNRDAATAGVVITGTWAATNQFEGSANNGAVWTAATATPMPGGTGVTTTTANGTWRIVVAGLTNLRVRASAYTNGTATVNIQASPAAMAWNIDTPLSVPMGGTGLTGGTSGGVLGFTAPTTLASSVLLGANEVVVGGGAGATPVSIPNLAWDNTNKQLQITANPASTNTILDVLKLTRSTTGVAGNGIGGALVIYVEDGNGNLDEALRFQASFPIAAHATQTGRVDITVMGAPGGSLTSDSTTWGVNAGVSNSGANQTVMGSGAGQYNTGANQIAMGAGAGYANTGDQQTGMGVNAGQNNTGANQTATGFIAGYSNTGANQTAAGAYAGHSNTGANETAMGVNAGHSNTGANETAMGVNAGQNNIADNQTVMGLGAGQYNSGDQQTGMGVNAGQNNTGASQTAAGLNAGQNNTGNYQTAMGTGAGQGNNWPNITRIGYQSSVYFPDDAGSLKNITEANITAANTITYVAHGFGTPGGKVNVRYLLTGGTPPVGLVHNTIYQFTVTSADVLALSGIAFPAAAFTGTLNNSTDTSNSIAIGVDANPTKANQAVLGPSSITETLLRGHVITTQAAVPTLSACGTGTPAMEAGSTDHRGFFTTGGGALTSCTMTFNIAYAVRPSCAVYGDNAVAVAGLNWTTAVGTLIVQATSMTAQTFGYICQ